MMIRWVLPVVVVALLLVACGGGSESESPLHMRGYDISEENYVALVKAIKVSNQLSWSILCGEIEGLSDEAADNFLKNLPATSDTTLPAGSTPKLGQVPDDQSLDRSLRIIRAECG